MEHTQPFLEKLVNVKETLTGTDPATTSGTLRKKYTFVVALAYDKSKAVGTSRAYDSFERAYLEAVERAAKVAEQLPDGEGWTRTYMCIEDTIVTVEIDNSISGKSTRDITTKKRWLTPLEIKEMINGIEQTRAKMVGVEKTPDRLHRSDDT